ncbi:MAG: hypothetical protein RLZZ241_581 [Bacteroidota bacterium]|jgi:hypothetical protein
MRSCSALFLILLFQSCSAQENGKETEIAEKANSIEIAPGGNSFTANNEYQNYITPEGIKSWNNPNVIWDTYVYLEHEGAYIIGIKGIGDALVSMQFEVEDNSFTFDFNPEISAVQTAGQLRFSKGYSKISLKGNSGIANYPTISGIYLFGDEPIKGFWVKDNEDSRFYWGRRGPSVHLSFTPPAEKDIEYYYTELLIPAGEDAVGSYFMANGFAQGYFGIQVNSESERRILFSVWSPYNTDNPGEIPEEFKIKLLAKGEGVYTGEFGNEGSGGQSYKIFPWKAETAYGFLTRAVPDEEGNTTFTSYFRETETGEWQLIASFLRPKTQTWYTRPHAFLENFIDYNGYLGRWVQYNNPWVYTTTGEWIPLTEARFTTDDIGNREFRKDLEGGIDSNRFYLRNGGFFNGTVAPGSSFILPTAESAPQIDFTALSSN